MSKNVLCNKTIVTFIFDQQNQMYLMDDTVFTWTNFKKYAQDFDPFALRTAILYGQLRTHSLCENYVVESYVREVDKNNPTEFIYENLGSGANYSHPFVAYLKEDIHSNSIGSSNGTVRYRASDDNGELIPYVFTLKTDAGKKAIYEMYCLWTMQEKTIATEDSILFVY